MDKMIAPGEVLLAHVRQSLQLPCLDRCAFGLPPLPILAPSVYQVQSAPILKEGVEMRLGGDGYSNVLFSDWPRVVGFADDTQWLHGGSGESVLRVLFTLTTDRVHTKRPVEGDTRPICRLYDHLGAPFLGRPLKFGHALGIFPRSGAPAHLALVIPTDQ